MSVFVGAWLSGLVGSRVWSTVVLDPQDVELSMLFEELTRDIRSMRDVASDALELTLELVLFFLGRSWVVGASRLELLLARPSSVSVVSSG